MLKILLDIDGVLVITPTWRQPDFLADGFMAFDKNCAKNFAKLISQTQAEVVLSSTHRIHHDIETWKEIFANRGIMIDKFSKTNDVKSYLDFQTREKEILDWVNQNSTEKFIIIDDDKSLRNLPSHIQKHWIETQFLTGFDNACLKQALNLANQYTQ